MKTYRQFPLLLAFVLGAFVVLPRVVAQGYSVNIGDILIANYDGGSVVKIDTVTGAQQQLGGAFAAPTDLVMNASGKLYITEWPGTIKQLDLTSGTLSTLMNSGSGPSQLWGITQGPTGDLFITSRGNNAIYRVNSTTGVPVLLTQGNLISTPVGIDFLDANHLVVVCLVANRLVSVSLADNTQSLISEGGALDQPWGVAVSGADIYVAGYDRQEVQRVSAEGVVTTIGAMPDFPYGIAVDPDANPILGLKGVAGSVVRVSPTGSILRTYTGPLIRQATGVEVSRIQISPPPPLNSPPVLSLPANATIGELTPYTANATATDGDLPAQTLTFALVNGPPGLTVSPAGAIAWTPTEAQGPSVNVVEVRVTDDGTPPASVTGSFTLTVSEANAPPAAVADTVFRRSGQLVKVSVADLLANDTDPEGGPVHFVGVTTPSANGAELRVDEGWVFYLPPPGAAVDDTFTYTVADQQNAEASAKVTVKVTEDVDPSQNVLRLTRSPEGVVTLIVVGIPGRTYDVQATPQLQAPDWTRRGEVTTDAQGTGEFIDPSPPLDAFFYRTFELPAP